MVNGYLLTAEMKSKHITQIDIAHILGISVNSFRNKIRNKTEFKISEVVIISNILYLSSEKRNEIFFGESVAKLDTEQ